MTRPAHPLGFKTEGLPLKQLLALTEGLHIATDLRKVGEK